MPKKAKKALEVSAKVVVINNNQKRYLLWSRPSLYGKAIKRYFVTRQEALEEQERLLKELADGGKDAVHDDATLRKHREDAKRALALANGRVTLEKAVAFWLDQNPAKDLRRTLKEACEEFYASRVDPSRNEEPVRKSTLAAYKKTLNPFAEDMTNCLISDIRENDLDDWVHEEEWSRPTRRFHAGNLKTFFRWALKKGYVKHDESKGLSKPGLGDDEIQFLAVHDVIRLLSAAQTLHPECSAAIGASLFCGLRSSELRQVEWSEVSKENKTILVTAGKSKTRSRRLIPITKNLWAWLAQEKNRTGLLIPPGWREKWLEIRKAAGFGANKPWPRNGCRHSFASYRLAIDSDVNKCAEEMGNSAEIIFRHYRGLIKDSSDAIAYWKLTPASLDSMARSFKK